MNKQEYINKLEKLNFNKEKYCIISGGSMVFNNIREETSDIDLMILPDYFNELLKTYKIKPSAKSYDNLYVFSNEVELKVSDFSKNDYDIKDVIL